ncbi:MAG: 30S ribosomal protein S6 [Clostridia bacterium]
MNKYELMFIISATINDEPRETLITKVKELLTSKGAEIVTFEKLGMKKLAYPINFKNEGFYCLVNFVADPAIISHFEKTLNITEGVVRSIVIRK